jgi:hypothetical protein
MHRRGLGRGVVLASLLTVAGGVPAGAATTSASGSGSPHVLLVGTFQGKSGQYKTIQAAVNAAHAGDWILVAPGDYHETDDKATAPSRVYATGDHGGVVVHTSNLHIRGLNRNTVIVDGTKAGAPTACSSAAQWQNLGPKVGGEAQGRNGIVVWKANNVSIQNLTACNFLGGGGDSGNEVWWNGGDGSGKIGLTGYTGSYLTGTSTFFNGEKTAAQYGIFSSNSSGPAQWNQIYGSNMNDSGMYVGACKQVCTITINHAWMENSALGYSGTNSGGAIVIENSQFDQNEDGVDTNTQIGGDPTAPQNGNCPGQAVSPITHTRSCWVFMHNNVHDNDNPNAPQAGSAAAGPIGTGMTVSGARNVTVMDNTFTNNGAWGTLFVPYPDSDKPVLGQTCKGTGGFPMKGFGCVYETEGDSLLDNTYVNDGYFGNPSNADFGQILLNTGIPSNCFAGNTAATASTSATSAPANLEQLQPTCGVITTTTNADSDLLSQVLCDTGFGGCPAGAMYPKATGVALIPLPANLPTMPNPCQGVPVNRWCSAGSGGSSASALPNRPVTGATAGYPVAMGVSPTRPPD